LIFARATDTLPHKPVEIKPHPYGVELGVLIRMVKLTESRTLQSFLSTEFSRVGPGTAKDICENAALLPNTKPKEVTREMAEKLLQGITKTKIISPPTNCISPIGEELLEKGLRKEINAEFYCATTRPPAVYRGNPFVIEAGIAYGGEQEAEGSVKALRYANRVPLLYQQGACAITKSTVGTVWRNYGLSQSRGALPVGPATIVLSINSVWVPFTSESKEAIAHYPEIIKEIKLALQEVGRKLSIYVHKKKKIQMEGKKRDYLETYIPHVAEALKDLVGYKQADEEKVKELLGEILEQNRGKLEKIEINNPDYDEELAKIGKEPKEDNPEDKTEDKPNKEPTKEKEEKSNKEISGSKEPSKEDKQKTLG
jgi:DNA topoisomerase-6 subunit B